MTNNSLYQSLISRLKQKHQKLSTRLYKNIKEGNFEYQSYRKKRLSVDRLKKLEKQLKNLGQKTESRIAINYKHWALGIAMGVLVSTSATGQDNDEKKKFVERLRKSSSKNISTTGRVAALNGFTLAQQLGEPVPQNVHTGDFDGDGDLDVLYVPYIGGPFILSNDGSSNFTAGPRLFTDVNKYITGDGSIVTDLDGDGDLDILIRKGNLPVDYTTFDYAYLNDGSGVFTSSAANFPAILYNCYEGQLGDIDGDGDADWVFEDCNNSYDPYASNGVLVYLNDGANTFTPSGSNPIIATGTGKSKPLGLVDLDNDGDLDIPLTHTTLASNSGAPYYNYNPGTRDFKALLNDGAGNFTDAAINIDPYNAYTNNGGTALATDIDGDGFVDILWDEYNSFYPILNDGAGNFTPQAGVVKPFLLNADAAEALDLNNDTFADLVSEGFSNDSTIVYQGDGTGSFAQVAKINGTSKNGDFDGDGDNDFLIFDGDINFWQHQPGFSITDIGREVVDISGTYDLAAVDVDLDGDVDIIQVGEKEGFNTVWLNDGTGQNFTKSQSFVNKSSDLITGDLDGDGDPDLAIANGETFNPNGFYAGISIFSNTGGNFTYSSNLDVVNNFRTGLHIEDMDGDGDLDIVGVGAGTVEIFDNTGGLNFVQGDSIQTYTTMGKTVAGDIDGDSDIDLIWTESGGNYLGIVDNNAGTISNGPTFLRPAGIMTTYDIDLGDIDGDGDLDLVITSGYYPSGTTNIYTMINDGLGTFTESANNFDTGTSVYEIELNDLDGDGDLDIILNTNLLNTVVFENDGTGVFTLDYTFPGIGDEYSKAAFGDFDGDGDTDVVFGGYYTPNAVYLNNIIQANPLAADSTALTQFFSSLNGPNWTDKTGWETGTVDTWVGVTLNSTGDRVSEVVLPNNGLTGAIPASVNNLDSLRVLDVSGNDVNGLGTDFSNLGVLQTLNLNNNSLDFADLTPVATAVTGITYQGQTVPDVELDTIITVGNPIQFGFQIGGVNNQYAWYRDSVLTDSIRNEIVIQSIQRDNMGEYYSLVTNPDVPGLTIGSARKNALASATINGVLKINATDNATAGEIKLLRVRETAGFDTTAIVSVNSAGEYIINDVVLFDYIMTGFADTVTHPGAIPTYYKLPESTVFWAEADTIKLFDSQVIDIINVFQTNPTGAVGQFSGLLEEEVPDGGRLEVRRRVRGAGVAMRRGVRTGRQTNSGVLEYYVLTNENGEFSIEGIEPGEYNVDIQYPGYPMDQTSFLDITIGSGNRDSEVQVEALVDQGKISVRQLIILNTEKDFVNGIKLYPNPTSTALFVEGMVGSESRVEIINMLGRKVIEKGLSDSMKIDVSDLVRGQYILRITDKSGNEITKQRIIVTY